MAGAQVVLPDLQAEAEVDAEAASAEAGAQTETAKPEDEVPSWLSNERIWWRHPVARLFIVWMILVLDMGLFGEDPVNDSHVEANLAGIGHIYNLYFVWPSGGLVLLRLVLIAACLAAGCYVGRQQIHHRLLRDRLRLFMFSGNMGSWMVMAGTCAVSSLMGAFLWNLLTLSLPDEAVGSNMGMEMNDFAKLAQTCSVLADMIAIIMITDAVLQDQTKYPDWAPRLKQVYIHGCNGYLRVIIVWVVAASALMMVPLGIYQAGQGVFKWDNRTVGGLSEVARALMVSCIVFCDLFTVVQDWDFPTFQQPIDIPLDKQVFVAGTFMRELKVEALDRWGRKLWGLLPTVPWPDAARRLGRRVHDNIDPSLFRFSISGSWLTYGPLFCVVCLDLFCTRTQLTYDPAIYGQYVSAHEQRVWTVMDEDFLRTIYKDGVLTDSTALLWEARRGDATPWNSDVELNSRYLASSLKYLAAAPGLLCIPTFWILVFVANRRPHLLQKMEKLRLERLKLERLKLDRLRDSEHLRRLAEQAQKVASHAKSLPGHAKTVRVAARGLRSNIVAHGRKRMRGDEEGAPPQATSPPPEEARGKDNTTEV